MGTPIPKFDPRGSFPQFPVGPQARFISLILGFTPFPAFQFGQRIGDEELSLTVKGRFISPDLSLGNDVGEIVVDGDIIELFIRLLRRCGSQTN